jgi:hypothetical protein
VIFFKKKHKMGSVGVKGHGDIFFSLLKAVCSQRGLKNVLT